MKVKFGEGVFESGVQDTQGVNEASDSDPFKEDLAEDQGIEAENSSENSTEEMFSETFFEEEAESNMGHLPQYISSQISPVSKNLLPVYRTPKNPEKGISYELLGSDLSAYDSVSRLLWVKNVGQADSLFGGFDFDRDGIVDAAYVVSQSANLSCGSSVLYYRKIIFVRGANGDLVEAVAPLLDKCFPELGYATVMWSYLGVLFGGSGEYLGLIPYKPEMGWFWKFHSGFQSIGHWYHPSTASYDQVYTNAKSIFPAASSKKYIADSNVPNGLIVNYQGVDRLVYFTSFRVVQYAITGASSSQLLADHPVVPPTTSKVAGRTYGFVGRDPENERLIVALSGTDTLTVYQDMLSGKLEADPWGGLERHLTLYDFVGNSLSHRFFSYARDAGDSYKYEGRLVYPANPFIRIASGKSSRIAYNVYENGHWFVHISIPGGQADQWTLKDQFIWDIRDVDGNGQDEIFISPTRDSNEPDVPGYYFSKWKTNVYLWEEASMQLHLKQSFSGIPQLNPFFREVMKSTSKGYFFPVQNVIHEGKLKLVFTESDKKASFQEVSF